MKVEDLKGISAKEIKELFVRICNSFENDANFYKNRVNKNKYDELLYNIFQDRIDRVKTRLTSIKNKKKKKNGK